MKIIKADALKAKPDSDKLGFGKYFTDYMYVADYVRGAGWHNERIQPFADLTLSPAAQIFHYGQGVFEGLKAYRDGAGRIRLFRPRDNFQRLNEACARLCIPPIDVDGALRGLTELLKTERDWIPTAPGTSLYIRPFIFAADANLSVHASDTYIFGIILSPVGAYYKSGLRPVRLLVEERYARACPGGTGFTKYIGNYGASLCASTEAEAAGFDQVMWLDPAEKKYVEEVGSMNIFFVVNGEVLTPALNGSILNGITRRSAIEQLRAEGRKVREERIAIADIIEDIKSGACTECFGTGTAAVISPVGGIARHAHNATPNGGAADGLCELTINGGAMGEISKLLYDRLTGIQTGTLNDPFGWTMTV